MRTMAPKLGSAWAPYSLIIGCAGQVGIVGPGPAVPTDVDVLVTAAGVDQHGTCRVELGVLRQRATSSSRLFWCRSYSSIRWPKLGRLPGRIVVHCPEHYAGVIIRLFDHCT